MIWGYTAHDDIFKYSDSIAIERLSSGDWYGRFESSLSQTHHLMEQKILRPRQTSRSVQILEFLINHSCTLRTVDLIRPPPPDG